MRKIQIVQQTVKFPDGSKIYYTTSPNGSVRRVVDYAVTKERPAEHVDNAGKYYYLKTLVEHRDDDDRPLGHEIYSELEYICSKATAEFDLELVRDIYRRVRQKEFFEQAEVFFTVVYLAMVDLEANKLEDHWLGKKMVLNTCRAVLLEGIPYEEAAEMYVK